MEILTEPKRRQSHDGVQLAGSGQKTQRRLNVRLLLISLAVLGVLGPAAYFWRSYRLGSMADAWLARADELEQDNQLRPAVAYLRRYLHLRPDDADGHIRTAQLLDRTATSWPEKQVAAAQYYRALGLAPDRHDLRRRLVEVLYQIAEKTGQITLAEVEAENLNKHLKDAGRKEDPTAQRVLALAEFFKSKAGDRAARERAAKQMRSVFDKQPGDQELATALAFLYRTSASELGLNATEAAKEADGVMEKMIAKNASDAQAFLKRFDYRRRFRLTGAHQDLERALTLGPKDVQVAITAGEYFLEAKNPQRDVNRSRDCFQQAVAAAPHSELAYWGLGRAYAAASDMTQAINTWKEGLNESTQQSWLLNSGLVAAYTANRQLAEADEALANLRRGIQAVGPQLPADQRLVLRNRVTRLEVQLHLARGEWARAVPLLRQVLDSSNGAQGEPGWEDDIVQSRTLLAQAYAVMECWDLAAVELDQLAKSSPSDWRRQVAAGEAWRQAGQLDRSIQYFQQAANLAGAPASLWIGLAQARLDQQMTRPDPKLRDWQAFRQAFEQARKAQPDAWQLRLVAASWQGSQEALEANRVKAVTLLKAGEKAHGDQREYWGRLVPIYERLKQPADADRALARFTEFDRGSLASMLLEVDLLAQRNQFDEAEKRLAKAIANSTEALRRGLLHRQMRLAFEARRPEIGQKRLKELIQLEPTNIRLLRQAAELALEAGDFSEVERYLDALESVEGTAGAISLFVRARRLLLESARNQAEPPVEADRLVAQLQAQRPNWAPAAALAAHLAERRGNAKLATGLYEKAIELGDRRLVTYERLISLLFAQNRLAEAQAHLDRMGRAAPSTERLESIAMIVAAKQDQRQQAIQLAEESVKKHPRDPMRRVWLAQMLLLNDRREEAHRTLRGAVEIAPTDARVYSALFAYYRRIGDLTAAEKTLRQLEEKSKLDPAEKAFALGQGYELIGKRKEAEEEYRQARDASPENSNIAIRLASVVAARDTDESATILQGVIDRDPNAHGARRALALLLATRGGDSAWTQAQQALRAAPGEEAGPVENERLRILLVINRGRTRKERLGSYAEAREAIESLMRRTTTVEPADRLILAGLYEAEAKLLEDSSKLHLARAQFQPLVEGTEPAESHVRLYADFLLRHCGGKLLAADRQKEDVQQVFLSDAARQIERLESRERKDKRFPTPQTLLLRARWLAKNNRAGEIPGVINPAAEKRLASLDKENSRLQFMLEIGQVYSAVQLEPEAEKWYRKAMAASARTYVALAQCLARQEKLSEAVKLCQEAAKTGDDPQPAIVAANLLTAQRTAKKAFPQAEPLLAQALTRHPANADLLFAVALLRTVQDRVDEAIGLFERVVAAAPKNVLALNNLSTLLAEHPKRRGEALEYIEKAIALVGRQGALLDTKGTILLFEGKSTEAVACLEEAVEFVAADPRYTFHLAAAYQRIGRTPDARAAFRRALDDGLDKQVLTAGDHELRAELEKAL